MAGGLQNTKQDLPKITNEDWLGQVYGVSSPVVVAENISGAAMYMDVEDTRIDADRATIQVYKIWSTICWRYILSHINPGEYQAQLPLSTWKLEHLHHRIRLSKR